jgi:hypothetical protein
LPLKKKKETTKILESFSLFYFLIGSMVTFLGDIDRGRIDDARLWAVTTMAKVTKFALVSFNIAYHSQVNGYGNDVIIKINVNGTIMTWQK